MKKDDGTNGGFFGDGPDRPLLGQGESRSPMLASIGSRLREMYAPDVSVAMPDRLQDLLSQLMAAESARQRKATG